MATNKIELSFLKYRFKLKITNTIDNTPTRLIILFVTWGVIGINTNPIRYRKTIKYSQNLTVPSLDILKFIYSLNILLANVIGN